MMNTGIVMMIVVVALLLGAGGFFTVRAILKHQHVQSLTSRGWTFIDDPGLSITNGLRLPPFGIGGARTVDDQIVGASNSGVQFQAFDYKTTAPNPKGYLLAMRLQQPLPELYVTAANPRPIPPWRLGAGRLLDASHGPYHIITRDPQWSDAAMAVIAPTLERYPMVNGHSSVDLSIDGDQLVLDGVPKKTEELVAVVEAMAGTAAALRAADLDRFVGEEPRPYLRIYEHPDWEYRRRDDSLFSITQHNLGQRNSNEALDVVLSHHRLLPLFSYTNHYTTQSSDGEGQTTTNHHYQAVSEFHPTFQFPPMSVKHGRRGINFESHDFNEAFNVQCQVPRLASDVFHPRMMDFMLERRPLPFVIDERGAVIMELPNRDISTLLAAERFFIGFFARVPRFVWEMLRQDPPDFGQAAEQA